MADKADNPHDALARAVFGEREHAAPLLRSILPAKLAREIDWDTLRVRPRSFVDRRLRNSQCDLLFEAQLGARPHLFYMLFEHQSTADPQMPWRILRYVVRIWEIWRERNPETPKLLPPILPIVLYHGTSPWSYSREMADLVGIPPGAEFVTRYLPRQAFLLADFGRWSDAELHDRALSALGRIALLSLRDARTRTDLVEKLLALADSFREVARQPTGLRALERVFRYILEVSPHVDAEALSRGLDSVQPEVTATVKTAGQKLREEGRQEGRLEGHREGREEGREEEARAFLLRLLRARFGEVPPHIEQRIRQTPLTLLETWGERLFEITTLEELFADE